jgi:uncharacterized phage protein gp47/JayE
MTFGLTPQGFIAPTVADKVASLGSSFQANIDGGLDLDPDQPMGQVIGTFANDITSAWEVLATVYNALNPNAAEGNALVNLSALSGTRPQVATFSFVVGDLTLNASTTVHAGSVVSVAGQPTNTWTLVFDVVSTTAGVYQGDFQANTIGPTKANPGTLTVINTPVVGWTAITNPTSEITGIAADTDATLRAKRELELAGQGADTVDAIRAKLLELPGMIQAFVFENTTLVTDANGLPGKAFRAVIWDGPGLTVADADIGNIIWKNKPSGIQSFGATSVTVNDSAGNPQVVNFDRASQLRTWCTCTVTPVAGVTIDANARTAVRNAIAAYATATFNLGVSIIDLPFRASALVPELTLDVPTFAFDFHSTPTNTANLAVSGLQIATVGQADISVNGTFS